MRDADRRQSIVATLAPNADRVPLLWGIAYVAMCPDTQHAVLDILTAGGPERRDWTLAERVLGDLEQLIAMDIAAVHATVQADAWLPAACLIAL
jgi:hypothetical protein